MFTAYQVSEMLTHFDFNPGKRLAIAGNSLYCSETKAIAEASGLDVLLLDEEIYRLKGTEHIESVDTISADGTIHTYSVDALAVDGEFAMEHKMRELLQLEWNIDQDRADTKETQVHKRFPNIFVVGDAYKPDFNFLKQYENGYSIFGGTR